MLFHFELTPCLLSPASLLDLSLPASLRKVLLALTALSRQTRPIELPPSQPQRLQAQAAVSFIAAAAMPFFPLLPLLLLLDRGQGLRRR